MDAYQRFYEKFSAYADIYILYILEAHFVEKNENGDFVGGWPIGYQYNYEQTKTIEERKNMVKLLIDEFNPTIPILMDNINNDFQNAYNPWPDKAFMFLNGKIKYISRPNNDGGRDMYWTEEIAKLL